MKCFKVELESALRLIQFNRRDYLHPYEGPIKINGRKTEERKSEPKSDHIQLDTKEESVSKETSAMPNTNILAALEANMKEKYKSESLKEETTSFKENKHPNKQDILVLEESF